MTFLGRLTLRGRLEVVSGIHIGTGSASGIGLIDNPVIRDPLTRRPIVPGSSLKGRLRSALETLLGNEKHPEVLRLFGSAPEDTEGNLTRIYCRDCHLTQESAQRLEEIETDSPHAEIKMENRIDRASGRAEHPRQSERLPAGAVLHLEFVYNHYDSGNATDDLQNLKAALDFVEDEYIGGSGSRGYGQVLFFIEELHYKSSDDYKKSAAGKSKHTDRNKWLTDACQLAGATAMARS